MNDLLHTDSSTSETRTSLMLGIRAHAELVTGLPIALVADQKALVCRSGPPGRAAFMALSMVVSAPRFSVKMDLLEGLGVVRVNREQPDVLVHALVHVAVELGERREVLADLVLLVRGLLQQARGDDKADVVYVDQGFA